MGVPFYDMKVNDQLKSDRFKDIVSFGTKYTMTGIVPNASLPGISNIELTLPKGKPPTHGSLFAEQWPSRMANPVPDLAGMYLRGMDVKSSTRLCNKQYGQAPYVHNPAWVIRQLPISVWQQ